jgi:hypothetical protein
LRPAQASSVSVAGIDLKAAPSVSPRKLAHGTQLNIAFPSPPILLRNTFTLHVQSPQCYPSSVIPVYKQHTKRQAVVPRASNNSAIPRRRPSNSPPCPGTILIAHPPIQSWSLSESCTRPSTCSLFGPGMLLRLFTTTFATRVTPGDLSITLSRWL